MNLRTAAQLSPAEYHRRRSAARRTQLEQFRQEKLNLLRAAVANIAPRFEAIRRVHIFGSILRPKRFRESSDIDLALECDDL